jgi:hypothetical protein
MRLSVAVIILAAMGLASYRTIRLTVADVCFRSGTDSGLARARGLEPGNLAFYAQAEDSDTLPILKKSVELNPFYGRGFIELGLAAEVAGNTSLAESHYLEAARVDRTYEPRWTLANFYFRRRNPSALFRWTNSALQMAYQDRTPLYQLCWRIGGDPDAILRSAIPAQPHQWAHYLNFLMSLGERLDAAKPVFDLLKSEVGETDLGLLLLYCDRLLGSDRLDEAVEVWNVLCNKRLLPYKALDSASGALITNGDFKHAPLEQGFDWKRNKAEGLSVIAPLPDGGLRVGFTGRQPEATGVVQQTLALLPSRKCRLSYRYRTEGIEPGSGLHWEIAGRGANAEEWLASSSDLSSAEWKETGLVLSTPAIRGPARLALVYRRGVGTTRIEGTLWLKWVRFEIAP